LICQMKVVLDGEVWLTVENAQKLINVIAVHVECVNMSPSMFIFVEKQMNLSADIVRKNKVGVKLK